MRYLFIYENITSWFVGGKKKKNTMKLSAIDELLMFPTVITRSGRVLRLCNEKTLPLLELQIKTFICFIDSSLQSASMYSDPVFCTYALAISSFFSSIFVPESVQKN